MHKIHLLRLIDNVQTALLNLEKITEVIPTLFLIEYFNKFLSCFWSNFMNNIYNLLL